MMYQIFGIMDMPPAAPPGEGEKGVVQRGIIASPGHPSLPPRERPPEGNSRGLPKRAKIRAIIIIYCDFETIDLMALDLSVFYH